MTYKMTSISIIYINEDAINQRIDNFLQKKFKSVPKSMIYRIIRIGKIRVNEKKIKPQYKLQIGDKVKIPPIKILHEKKNSVFINKKQKSILNNILYEDNDLLIINKPSGIAVHGGSGIKLGIIEYIRKCRPLEKSIELVHRLDRDTSGILLLSKKRQSLISLHEQIREKKIQKKYIALVHGLWPVDLKKISKPILKTYSRKKEKKILIDQGGKPSETFFQVKKRYSCTTLMSIKPKTGRTHQIRIHTLYAGYPILFDKIYGKNSLDKSIQNKIKINRLLLHASSINFTHPKNRKKIYIKAPLDADFKNYLTNLI